MASPGARRMAARMASSPQLAFRCGDEAIRAAMRLAPGEAMLLLDEVCFNRLCRPVMRSLSYYTNFFDFSILRKLL